MRPCCRLRQKLHQQAHREQKAEKGHAEQAAREKAEKKKRATDGALIVLSKEEAGDIIVPVEVAQHLQEHQVDGIRFMWDNTVRSIALVDQDRSVPAGCILAHCMGLGKSLQVVALTATILSRSKDLKIKHVMVMCPVNVLRNWDFEFEKWAQMDFEVYTLTSDIASNKNRAALLEDWMASGGVLIIGYESFRNLATGSHVRSEEHRALFQTALLQTAQFVVCDEGHTMKNPKSAISRAVAQLNTRRRVVLTGTPLQNNLMEYWTMINFVAPDHLGSETDFRTEFCTPIIQGQHSDSTELQVRVMT